MAKGRIWWVFDNRQELEEWKRGREVEILTEEFDPLGLLHVIFAVDRDRANEILGYDVDDEEWLEDEEVA